MIVFLLGPFVCLSVLCLFVSLTSFSSFWAGVKLCKKRIVNIVKVYIKRNKMQVELIRLRKKILPLFMFSFAKQGNQCNIAH